MIRVQPIIIRDIAEKEAATYLRDVRADLRHFRGVEQWVPDDHGVIYLMLHAYAAGVRASAKLTHSEKPFVATSKELESLFAPALETSSIELKDSALVFLYQDIQLPDDHTPQENFYGELPHTDAQGPNDDSPNDSPHQEEDPDSSPPPVS